LIANYTFNGFVVEGIFFIYGDFKFAELFDDFNPLFFGVGKVVSSFFIFVFREESFYN
jgi:hypothetical protein